MRAEIRRPAVAGSIDAGRATRVPLVIEPLLDNPRSPTAKVAAVLGGTAIQRTRLSGFLNSQFDPFLNQLFAAGLKGANIRVACPRGEGWEDRRHTFSFLYLAVRALLGTLVRSRRGLDVKDIELLVLRHELEILRRQVGRAKLGLPDRALLAAAACHLPRSSRGVLLVAPRTLLRWHQALVRRKWRQTPGQRGRPKPPAEVRELGPAPRAGESTLGPSAHLRRTRQARLPRVADKHPPTACSS